MHSSLQFTTEELWDAHLDDTEIMFQKAFILQSIRLQLDLICLVQGFIAPTCHLQAIVSDP